MAQPISLQNSFRMGMKRDFAREDMPEDSAWNLIDYLPEVLGAKLRKRGGWSYASPAITASASRIVAGIKAPFASGTTLLIWDEDGEAYHVGSATAATAITASSVVTIKPVFYDDKVIAPHVVGSSAPQQFTWNGSAWTVATLGGSPPAGRWGLIYKDVLWLASSAASSERIWFSTAGNPGDTWDLTNKYLDVSYPITGMAALSNAVFVFSLERTARIRGSVPPPDSDFIVDDPIFEVGCTDSRSITNYRDKVIWANAQGLYISDGSAMEDLTRICGMKAWWRGIMDGTEGFTTGTSYTTSWRISTGVFGDFLFYSVLDASLNKVDAGIIDLARYVWTRISNFDGNVFIQDPFPQELYFGRTVNARLAKVSTMFTPSATYEEDADGTDILPILETPFYGYDGTLKTFRQAFLEYDLRDSGGVGEEPLLTVSYLDSPEETSYTALSPTLAETLELSREHLPMNFPARGVAFKLAQSGGNSADTRIYGLHVTAQQREGNR